MTASDRACLHSQVFYDSEAWQVDGKGTAPRPVRLPGRAPYGFQDEAIDQATTLLRKAISGSQYPRAGRFGSAC